MHPGVARGGGSTAPGVWRAARPCLAGSDLRLPPRGSRDSTAQQRAHGRAGGARRWRRSVTGNGRSARDAAHSGVVAAAFWCCGVPSLCRELHSEPGRRCSRVCACRARVRAEPRSRARCRALVRDDPRPASRPRHPGRHARARAGTAASRRIRTLTRGHARLLGFGKGEWSADGEPRALRRAGRACGMGRGALDPAHVVPRPRWRPRAWWRAGQPRGDGAGARLGRGPIQGDRTGRGDLRALWQPHPRATPSRAGDVRRAPRVGAGRAGADGSRRYPLCRAGTHAGFGSTRRVHGAHAHRRIRRVFFRGHAGARAGAAAPRFPTRTSQQ